MISEKDWNFIGIFSKRLSIPRPLANIKESPGDFFVCEVLKSDVQGLFVKRGYPLFLIRKYNTDVLEAKSFIEKLVASHVNVLGLKDKRALVYQLFSARSKRAKVKKFSSSRLSLITVGMTSRPLTKKDLLGNCFKIRVKLIDELDECSLKTWKTALVKGELPNFYGPQRFGFKDPNHLIGEAIVKREFAKAASLILKNDYHDEVSAIRNIRSVPITIRRLFVQAYQAFIFNKVLSFVLNEYGELPKDDRSQYIKKSRFIRLNDEFIKIPLVPLPGYAFRPKGDLYSNALLYILEQEDVKARNFFVKGLEEVSVEGGFRPASILAWHVNCLTSDKVLTINFILSMGGYATIALRELIRF